MSNSTDNLIVVRGNPDDVTAWVQKACRPIEGSHQPSVRKSSDFFLWRLFHNFDPVPDEELAEARETGEGTFSGWGVDWVECHQPHLDRPSENEAHLQVRTYWGEIGEWVDVVARDHPELELDYYFQYEGGNGPNYQPYRGGYKKRGYDYTHTLFPAGKCDYAFRLNEHELACESTWKRVEMHPRQWRYRLERARFCMAFHELRKQGWYDPDDGWDPEPFDGTDILFPPADCLGQVRLDLDAAARWGAENSAEYWLLRADLAEADGESDTVLTHLTAAIKADKSCPAAYCRRAEHYLSKGLETAALRDVNLVIKRFPSFPKAHLIRSRLSSQGAQQQLTDLDRYLGLNPADWVALLHRARLRQATKRYAEACQDFEECRCVRGLTGDDLDYLSAWVRGYVFSMAMCHRWNEVELYALEALKKVAPRGRVWTKRASLRIEVASLAIFLRFMLAIARQWRGSFALAVKDFRALENLQRRYPDAVTTEESEAFYRAARTANEYHRAASSKKAPASPSSEG